MSYNRREMERLARDLADFADAGVRELTHQVARATTTRVGKAPGPAVRSGEMAGSLRITLNRPSTEKPVERSFYPRIGAAEVDAELTTFALGDTVIFKWIAEHANIIEGGRRRSKAGHMIGSDQNPEGWVGLGVDEATERMDAWRYA